MECKNVMQMSDAIHTMGVSTSVPIIRMKRVAGETPDAVHVRYRKRRRISERLNELDISSSSPEPPNSDNNSNSNNLSLNELKRYRDDDNSNTNDANANDAAADDDGDDDDDDRIRYVTFKRLNVRNGDNFRNTGRKIVDIDNQFATTVNKSNEVSNGDSQDKNGKHDEQGDYIMYGIIPDDDELEQDKIESKQNGGVYTAVDRKKKLKKGDAILDAEENKQLQEILNEYYESQELHKSSDEDERDESDADAQSVDYPSTPESGTDDEDGYVYDESRRDGYGYGYGADEDENENDDDNDYMRYEDFENGIDYDTEC